MDKRFLLISIFSLLVILIGASTVLAYNEAPMLKKQVEQGVLPSVDKRLPEEPLVIKPNNEVGKYGGTITLGAVSSSQWSPALQSIQEYMLMLSRDLSKTIPNIAKDWKFSNEGKTFTLYLRKGMKWSDGKPFTADDIMFWYKDVLQNEELTPIIPDWIKADGKLAKIKKIDDYTVEYDFAKPYWGFIHNFDSTSFRGTMNFGFMPAHALKKYHIKYNPDADKLAQKAGYDHWWQLFDQKSDFSIAQVPEGIPTLSAWILKKKTPTGVIFERNPYYFKVDTAGNQLPYIDEIRAIYFNDTETHKMKMLSGEIDYEGWGTAITDFPVFKKNEDSGDYKSWLGLDLWTTAAGYRINQNYTKDPVLGKILRNKKFRQALSLAINRTEINEVVGLGNGSPRQATVHPNVPGYKEEWAHAYAEYNPEKARKLLDEIGLDKKNSSGWRLRSDGKPLSLSIVLVNDMPFWPSITQLVRDYWRDIGINAEMKIMDREYYGTFTEAGNHQISTWVIDGASKPSFIINKGAAFNVSGGWAPLWWTWLNTDGQEGEEPPTDIKQLYNWCMNLPHVSPQKQIELTQKIGDYFADNLFIIGTVGMMGKPIVANKDLGNLRKKAAADNADVGGVRNAWMEQFYWKTAAKRGE